MKRILNKMKFIKTVFFCILLLLFLAESGHTEKVENIKVTFPFYIYRTYGDIDNLHYYLSGLLGDTYAARISGNHRQDPFVGTSCIKIIIDFSNRDFMQFGWIGLNWLEPANNWGLMPIPGYNLTGATKLVFYAKGETGTEIIKFRVGGVRAPYGDSGESQTLKLFLTRQWERYEIDLSNVKLSRIICALSCAIAVSDNPDGAVFYLDNIYFDNK